MSEIQQQIVRVGKPDDQDRRRRAAMLRVTPKSPSPYRGRY